MTRLARIVLATTLGPCILLSTACDTKSASSRPAGGLRVAMMPKLVGIDYFNACEKGGRQAAAELGITFHYDGPPTNSTEEQSRMINTWIASGRYDVFVVAPNDPDQIAPVLKKARQRGIHVLTYDADAAPDARAYFVNMCTYRDVAVALIDLLAKHVGPDARYVTITGSLTAANQRHWVDEMESYRKSKYPKMQNLLPRPIPSGEDQARATQATTALLKAHPTVQAIFGMTSQALPGAAEAVRAQGVADRVFVTGVSTPKTMRSYVDDGTVKEFVLWSPVDLGYLAVHAAKLIHEGKLTGDTIQAGRLGTIAITGDEILLGKPINFTKENIADYDF